MSLLDLKGVYIIKNKINGNIYIGSTCASFKARFSAHKCTLGKGTHRNPHLQRAVNKYGLDAFLFWPIFFLSSDAAIRRKEQQCLDCFKPQYNIAIRVEGPLAGRKLSKEHRAKLSEAKKGKTPWNKGIPFSAEVRAKMSRNGKGKGKGSKRPPRTSLKRVVRSDGEVFASLKEAANSLNVKPNTIAKSISDKTISRRVKGYTFTYIE